MYYTQEQIDRANQADLVSFLQSQGEQLTRAGNEYRWKRHDSLTIRGNIKELPLRGSWHGVAVTEGVGFAPLYTKKLRLLPKRETELCFSLLRGRCT